MQLRAIFEKHYLVFELNKKNGFNLELITALSIYEVREFYNFLNTLDNYQTVLIYDDSEKQEKWAKKVNIASSNLVEHQEKGLALVVEVQICN